MSRNIPSPTIAAQLRTAKILLFTEKRTGSVPPCPWGGGTDSVPASQDRTGSILTVQVRTDSGPAVRERTDGERPVHMRTSSIPDFQERERQCVFSVQGRTGSAPLFENGLGIPRYVQLKACWLGED
jgi:hypothetical protein